MANGSSPINFFAHQTAWPRPSAFGCRVKNNAPAGHGRVLRLFQQILLPASLERLFKLGLKIEMLLEQFLVPTGDKDKFLDAGIARFLNRMLDERAVAEGQHFLRQRLGRGQKPCPQSRDGEDGLADGFWLGHGAEFGMDRAWFTRTQLSLPGLSG